MFPGSYFCGGTCHIFLWRNHYKTRNVLLTSMILYYLILTRRRSLVPSANCLFVRYTPGSSCSVHSVSMSLAFLIDGSSLEEVVVLDASTYDPAWKFWPPPEKCS
ncbi:hypothetical protein AAZX31_01G023700 [Glycine max]